MQKLTSKTNWFKLVFVYLLENLDLNTGYKIRKAKTKFSIFRETKYLQN